MQIRVKEEKLSIDGIFLLNAFRCQSARLELQLRPDEQGFVTFEVWDEGSIEGVLVLLRPFEADKTDTWMIPGNLIERFRSLEIGAHQLINRAGRELRKRLSDSAIYGYRWSVREWIDTFGEAFGIQTASYVRQMCRGDLVGVRTKSNQSHKTKLPAPFRPIQHEGRWFITV